MTEVTAGVLPPFPGLPQLIAKLEAAGIEPTAKFPGLLTEAPVSWWLLPLHVTEPVKPPLAVTELVPPASEHFPLAVMA
jgi:hypothetical protein